MLDFVESLIEPGGEVSLQHQIADKLLTVDGHAIADGATFHAVLTFHAFLKSI
jgi:hypothetical protein